MGQVIGSAAKPKRCNISKLSQLDTPAAGEYILVSSDNSMNAAGQGNFDCYMVGNGRTAATNLALHSVNDLADEMDSLLSEKNYIDGQWINGDGNVENNPDRILMSDYIPVAQNDTVKWVYGTGTEISCLQFYDSEKEKVGGAWWSNNGSEGVRVLTPTYPTTAYLRAGFLKSESYTPAIYINNAPKWTKKEDGKIAKIHDEIESMRVPVSQTTGYDPNSLMSQKAITERLYGYNNGIDVSAEYGDSDWVWGKYCATTGYLVSGTYWGRKDFELVAGQQLTVYTEGSGAVVIGKYTHTDGTYGEHYSVLVSIPSGKSGYNAYTYEVEEDGIYTCFVRNNTTDTTPRVVASATVDIPGVAEGSSISYDNTKSGLEATTMQDAVDELSSVKDYSGQISGTSELKTKYGAFATYYLEQMDELENQLSWETPTQGESLRFIHIGDNHGATLGSRTVSDLLVTNLTDISNADFFVHTGDAVNDKYSDDFSSTLNAMLAMTKPAYFTIGNHDAYAAPSLADKYSKFIEPLNTHNGLTGNTKTYYSVDYTTQRVKCIFLDQNDNVGTWDSSTMNMNTVCRPMMSPTQINWFISELEDAITNGLHVAVFMHIAPTYLTPISQDWNDYNSDPLFLEGRLDIYLARIINAFQNGLTTTIEADGNQYSVAFASKGKFIAWFCSHVHCDVAGTLVNYPNQLCVCAPRPFIAYDNYSQEQGAGGMKCNFVYINTHSKRLGVIRIGNRKTMYGGEKVGFNFRYSD